MQPAAPSQGEVAVEVVSVSGIDHAEVATKILASLAAGSPVDIGFAAKGGMRARAWPWAWERLRDFASLMQPGAGDFGVDDLISWDGQHVAEHKVGEAGLEMPGEDWTRETNTLK